MLGRDPLGHSTEGQGQVLIALLYRQAEFFRHLVALVNPDFVKQPDCRSVQALIQGLVHRHLAAIRIIVVLRRVVVGPVRLLLVLELRIIEITVFQCRCVDNDWFDRRPRLPTHLSSPVKAPENVLAPATNDRGHAPSLRIHRNRC